MCKVCENQNDILDCIEKVNCNTKIIDWKACEGHKELRSDSGGAKKDKVRLCGVACVGVSNVICYSLGVDWSPCDCVEY